MRCPRCNSDNVKPWANIIVDGKPAKKGRCRECNKFCQSAYCSYKSQGFKMDPESIRQRAITRSLNWAKKPEAYKKMIYAKRNTARIKALGLCQPKVKEGFIGMLGDIEVYALQVGHMGRQPQGLPDRWNRLLHGHPKLESPRKRSSTDLSIHQTRNIGLSF